MSFFTLLSVWTMYSQPVPGTHRLYQSSHYEYSRSDETVSQPVLPNFGYSDDESNDPGTPPQSPYVPDFEEETEMNYERHSCWDAFKDSLPLSTAFTFDRVGVTGYLYGEEGGAPFQRFSDFLLTFTTALFVSAWHLLQRPLGFLPSGMDRGWRRSALQSMSNHFMSRAAPWCNDIATFLRDVILNIPKTQSLAHFGVLPVDVVGAMGIRFSFTPEALCGIAIKNLGLAVVQGFARRHFVRLVPVALCGCIVKFLQSVPDPRTVRDPATGKKIQSIYCRDHLQKDLFALPSSLQIEWHCSGFVLC